MQSFREYRLRFRQDPAFRRTVYLLVSFIAALAAEVALLSRDLPRHRELLLHSAVTLAVIALPFTMLAVVVRLPAGRKRIKRRYIVRPFGNLSANPTCDGGSIASLLHREIISWRSSAVGRIETHSGAASSAAVNVSLGIASFPLFRLDWLWAQLRYFLTGKRDVIIDGLVLDSSSQLRLKVWTSDSEYTWVEEVAEIGSGKALDDAITTLATRILESLDPVLLARIHWDRWNHDEAIRLMAQEDVSKDIHLLRAQLQLDAKYLSQAEQTLQQLETTGGPSDEMAPEFYRVCGELSMFRGEFVKARDFFQKAMDHRSCEARLPHVTLCATANSYVYENDLTAAIATYTDAERLAMAELGRLTDAQLDRVRQVLDRRISDNARPKVTNVLWRIVEITINRSRCKGLLGQDPVGDLQQALTVIDAIRHVEPVPSPGADLKDAVTSKALAHHYVNTADDQAFQDAVDRAISYYDRVIEHYEQSQPQSSENISALVDLAWAYCGKGFCLLSVLSRPSEDADTDGPLWPAAEWLVRRFRELPKAKMELFAARFHTAQQLGCAADKKYPDNLCRAAATLQEAMLIEFEPASLHQVCRDLEGADFGFITQMEPPASQAAEKELASEAGKKACEAGLLADEVRRLCDNILRLVHALASCEHPEAVDKLLWRANIVVDAEQSLNATYDRFRELSEAGWSRALQAEGYYGLACFHAMNNEAVMAATNLMRAGEVAGENTFAFVNRAKLDEDFDKIRSDPSFATLVGAPGAKSIARKGRRGRRWTQAATAG